MTWLAIETALSACSVAAFDGEIVVADRHELIERGHAERLVPMIAEVLADAGWTRADALVVDIGPGSFTGLRVGIAAAKALGLAWGAPVQGYQSTALVAAGAFADDPGLATVFVALDALRGEVYAQAFDRSGATGDVVAIAPAAAVQLARGHAVAGSGAVLLAAIDPQLTIIEHAWPRARDAVRLPAAARRLTPSPLYIRAPDAKLPGRVP